MDNTKKKKKKLNIYMKKKQKTKTISDLEIVRSIPSARRIFDHYMSEKNGINTQKFFTLLYIYILVFIL